MKFFIYDNVSGDVSIEDGGLLLTKEFSKLVEPERNKTPKDKTGKNRTRAFREFKYIYLFLD